MANKSFNFIFWNTINVKNKIAELQIFLHTQNTNIAIVTETWLSPSDKIRFRNYSTEKTESPQLQINQEEATHKDIHIEDIPQPNTSNIDTIKIKLIITPTLTPKTKVTEIDLDNIIPPHETGHFIIGGDFNAKHPIWNNLNRNANGSKIKNHSDQIIHSLTYTHKKPLQQTVLQQT